MVSWIAGVSFSRLPRSELALQRVGMLRHKAYGKQIRLIREARCLTQQQLARAAGYSVKTIWKAEQGRALKRQTLSDIARALDVEPETIARLPAAPRSKRNEPQSAVGERP